MNLWKDRNFKPMLLKTREKPFRSSDYIFELKFDGVRALVFVSPNSLSIQSRNGWDLTFLFPELENLKSLVKKRVIFDGELVLFENGKPSFKALQKRLHLKSTEKIKLESFQNPIVYAVFDILYENKDLTHLPLFERKQYLNCYFDTDFFIKCKIIDTEGLMLFKWVKKMNLEGMVAKLKTGKYYINQRTNDFIKIKNSQVASFYIGGYEINKTGLSLAIGEFCNDAFYYVGKVNLHKSHSLYKQVLNCKKDKNFFMNFQDRLFYIKPTLTCKVRFLERTKNNRLRHPILDSDLGKE